MNKIYDWFEERLEVQAIADDISSKYVPPHVNICLLYTSPSPRDQRGSRMPSSA